IQVLQGEATPVIDNPATALHEKNTLNNRQHLRVLLVDDNAINLKLAKTFIENRGIQVATAEHGEEATEMASKQYYDLILMDLHMPRMDGFAATEYIRNHPGPCKNSIIIALTANAMQEEKVQAYNAGMNDILLKPISENSLFEILARWLNQSQAISTGSQNNNDTETTPAIYDADQALKLTGGNAQLASELLGMLLSELPGHKQRIENCLLQSDLDGLKTYSHKLHGATSYCGVPMLRKCARELENIVDSKQHLKLDKAVHDLMDAMDALMDFYQTQTEQPARSIKNSLPS
ncbi:MAG: two-component system, NarL family, sensor histidine kinase BarA, partial [Pseudomonadota bacterium]|nr:two-component system, NarL family, sensor histidine kinase BarA [Pseudomonadota bacterium]